jgi:hypothetical protein
MSPTPSLATTSRACAQAFIRLCTLLKDPQHGELSGLAQSAIEDECGRFRIWAGNLGALQQLPSPTSLDHRLRQSPKIACHIHELLEILKDSLQDGKSPDPPLFRATLTAIQFMPLLQAPEPTARPHHTKTMRRKMNSMIWIIFRIAARL